MSEPRILRLHNDLYAAKAVDEAIALYAAHAQITRADEGEHTVLHIESPKPARAEKVAKELANYALGLTIQTRVSRTGVAS